MGERQRFGFTIYLYIERYVLELDDLLKKEAEAGLKET